LALNSAAAPAIRFRNSTLSGNLSDAAGSAVGFSGAGVGSMAFFEFSTIAGNTASVAAGAVATADAGQSVFLRGSILAGNSGLGGPSNCSGPGMVSSQGYNVESANTCNLVANNPDLINADPLLAPLAISTAPGAAQTTRTHGLYDGSPALNFVPRTPLDKCDPAYTDDQDQRGISRPAPAGFCDAGSFEGSVGPAPATAPTAQAPAAVTTPPPKKCRKGRKLKKGKCVKKKRKRR
jgi:hypothetical protein